MWLVIWKVILNPAGITGGNKYLTGGIPGDCPFRTEQKECCIYFTFIYSREEYVMSYYDYSVEGLESLYDRLFDEDPFWDAL